MSGFFRLLRKDSVAQWSFWITLCMVILLLASVILSYANLPPFIPLYNQMPWGYARLGKTYELFIPLALVLIFAVTNFVFGFRLLDRIPLLARFLFITTVTITLLTFIFTIRLILVVL